MAKRLRKGMSIDERLNRRWDSIQRRCTDVSQNRWNRYGGRGIKNLWKSPEHFAKDMRESFIKHARKVGYYNTTIDRIDNNGNYCKGNCRWATREAQNWNRSSRVEISYQGETRSIFEWADYLKIPRMALWLRVFRYRWTLERAFTQRVRTRSHTA